ncbi:MAG: glycosyltransferase family 4 protein [Methylovirgula sp.]
MAEQRPPLKILSIAHVAVSRAAGRLRYYPLAARADLDLKLLVPAKWRQFGRTLTADPADDPGLKVEISPIILSDAGPMSWYLHLYPKLRQIMRRFTPDVVHLWEEPWGLVALQAALLKGRAALVLEVDQNILKRLPPPFEAIRRFVLRRTDHILSRSPDATQVVRACGYEGPATLIGYGVDQDVFHPATSASPDRDAKDLRIGYVGRLVEEKGLDDALEALVQTKSCVSLAIMGEGAYEPVLRQRVAELGLQSRVSFQPWGGVTEVADFIRGLDALILLTRTTKVVREQFGRVIVEAQSCGIPVIGSQCGAIPNVVSAGGWIVPEKSPARLAELLDAIAADPEERHRRGLLAQANVANRFTYTSVAQVLASTWIAAAEARATRQRSRMQLAQML